MKRALLLTAAISGLLCAFPSAAQKAVGASRMLLVSVPNAEVRTESGLYFETPSIIEVRKVGKRITFSKDGYRDVTIYFPIKQFYDALDIAQNAGVEVSKEYIFVKMGSEYFGSNDNMPVPPPEFRGPHPTIELIPMPQPTAGFSASRPPQAPEKGRLKD